jgi:TIR domain-containing protein
MQGDGGPIEVFYSYSHDDEEYRKKLGKHLSVFRRARLITHWHDRDIDAGTAWQEEIDRHPLSADIVLLLVAPASSRRTTAGAKLELVKQTSAVAVLAASPSEAPAPPHPGPLPRGPDGEGCGEGIAYAFLLGH